MKDRHIANQPLQVQTSIRKTWDNHFSLTGWSIKKHFSEINGYIATKKQEICLHPNNSDHDPKSSRQPCRPAIILMVSY